MVTTYENVTEMCLYLTIEWLGASDLWTRSTVTLRIELQGRAEKVGVIRCRK